MSRLIIQFSNLDEFEIDPEIIAEHRASYYSTVDGFTKGSQEWKTEMHISLNHLILLDWMTNNMDWVDLEPHAKLVSKKTPPNYEEMWQDISIKFK